MKKRWLFVVLLLQAGSCLFAQTTIVQWNFNDSTVNPSIGTGSIYSIGGTTYSFAAGVGTTLDPNIPGNRAINTTNYPAQGTLPKTAGLQIESNTLGYKDIYVKFHIRHSDAAARRVVVQYWNGTTWQDVGSYIAPSSNNTNNPNDFSDLQIIDLTTLASANNSTNIKIRFVTDFSNSSSYLPANASSNSYVSGPAPNGSTIRYDLVTIAGTPTTCSVLATQQATGLRLLKTDNSSAQLTLNRGDGTGCLVLCSANTPPNTAPVGGISYNANSNYTSGSPVGNAFAVYNTQVNNPSTHYLNINGLTAGTKYYVAAYEYSSSGYCYLNPGTLDSFYCNSTILYPGDMQFVGFDNYVSANGYDAYAITNLKPLRQGTSFQIVNSRYEAGAAANVRTQHWYCGNDNIHNDLEIINILYIATTPLPPGSVMSFDFDGGARISNIKVGNAASSAFTISSNATNSLLNSAASPDPEQLFLTQGRFTPVGTRLVDLYSLLEGHVLHGISLGKAWVDFSQRCDSTTTTRESRLPPDIKCLNVAFTTTGDYGYYQISPLLHTGSQGSLLSQLANRSNWTYGNGTNVNDISLTYTVPFVVTTAPVTANWTGNAGPNWFNCSSWENLYVPDSTASSLIPITSNAPVIDVSNTLSTEYGSLATARNLSIINAVSLSGNSADKLIVYDSLVIGSTGTLTTSGTATDTVTVRGSILNLNTNGLQLKTNAWLNLHGNRQILPINVSLARTTTPDSVIALSLNNPPGININTGGFESLQKLELANGILSPAATAFHYLGTNCAISSPISYYGAGEPNIGWEKSYIDGKAFIRTNTTNNYTAPLGSKQKGVFTPMIVHPSTVNAFVYEAGYIGLYRHESSQYQYC